MSCVKLRLSAKAAKRYRRLCNRCGYHTEHELAEYLQECRPPPRCPIARLLRECGELKIRLPTVFSLGKVQRELRVSCCSISVVWPLPHWQRRRHTGSCRLTSRHSRPGLMDLYSALPAALRNSLSPEGHPMMVLKQPLSRVAPRPRRPSVLWLVPRAIPLNPGWLEPLRRVLDMVDTALFFLPLDTGERSPKVPGNFLLIRLFYTM
jgi:hypothetical protein